MEAEEIVGALLTPEGQADPYAFYAAAQQLGPVKRFTGQPNLLCMGYAEVNSVLRDSAFGKLEFDSLPEQLRAQLNPDGAYETAARSVLGTNPPGQRRVRSLINTAFTPRRVAGLEPAIVRMTDALLDDLAVLGAGGEPVDFMENVAFRLPVDVICELLGIPQEDRYRFRPLASDLIVVLELLDDFKNLGPADKAAAEMRGYLSDLAEQRRDEPQDDLVSALVAVNDAQDGRLSDVELIANLVVLFVAGFETTTNLLGNGIHLGFEHPEILARVREGAITTAAFVEEVLRYDAPVQLTSRHAVADGAMVGEEPLAKGDRVFLLIGAANRDPRRFENPNVFDPTRPDNQSLSFGAGIHYCLGQGLARLEAQIVFEKLLARFPGIAAAGPAERRSRLAQRGYQTQPVTLGAAI